MMPRQCTSTTASAHYVSTQQAHIVSGAKRPGICSKGIAQVMGIHSLVLLPNSSLKPRRRHSQMHLQTPSATATPDSGRYIQLGLPGPAWPAAPIGISRRKNLRPVLWLCQQGCLSRSLRQGPPLCAMHGTGPWVLLHADLQVSPHSC